MSKSSHSDSGHTDADEGHRNTLRARIREALEDTIHRVECRLVCVELTNGPNGQILRLYVDKDGGVNVADCAMVSRAISPELDVLDFIPGAYRLEVSSPGIDRPVELLEDYERFSGLRASVRLLPGHHPRRFKGILRGLEDDCVLLEAEDETHHFPLDQIDRCRLDLNPDEFASLATR